MYHKLTDICCQTEPFDKVFRMHMHHTKFEYLHQKENCLTIVVTTLLQDARHNHV